MVLVNNDRFPADEQPLRRRTAGYEPQTREEAEQALVAWARSHTPVTESPIDPDMKRNAED